MCLGCGLLIFVQSLSRASLPDPNKSKIKFTAESLSARERRLETKKAIKSRSKTTPVTKSPNKSAARSAEKTEIRLVLEREVISEDVTETADLSATGGEKKG